jgi:hypothetical protein
VFEDGICRELYAGGAFTMAGDVPANRIAKWDGEQWSALGNGMGNGSVDALAGFNTQTTGPGLFAGGSFRAAGGELAVSIAEWTNTGVAIRWTDVGNGTTHKVLFAGGLFTAAGSVPANDIAKWDGTNWFALDVGIDSVVNALAIFDDPPFPVLHAGGQFTSAGGVPTNNIAQWDDDQWSAVGSGIGGGSGPFVSALTFDSAGPALYVGGQFTSAGSVSANNVAKWNGTNWSALGDGMDGPVLALTMFDDGTGPALYAGGAFTIAGGVTANGVAKWNGTNWSPLGSGVAGFTPAVHSLTAFQDGTGAAVLFAGGSFDTADGVYVSNIARWDGTHWSALGAGVDNVVDALTTFNDGSGLALYAGGEFTIAGTVTANRIAKWDLRQWSALGSGMDNVVDAITVFDDGSGLALYAGGEFTLAGGVSVNKIAKWNCP